jgi:hypothetical protein
MNSKLWRFLRWLRGPVLPIGGEDARPHGPLIVCGACGRHMANPVAWHAIDDSRWRLRLRCGECEWRREVTVSNEAAEQLESDLEPGLRTIASVVARLDRERMRRDVAVLIAGLEHDLIDADDFAR